VDVSVSALGVLATIDWLLTYLALLASISIDTGNQDMMDHGYPGSVCQMSVSGYDSRCIKLWKRKSM
jgi:hypothetical protein